MACAPAVLGQRHLTEGNQASRWEEMIFSQDNTVCYSSIKRPGHSLSLLSFLAGLPPLLCRFTPQKRAVRTARGASVAAASCYLLHAKHDLLLYCLFEMITIILVRTVCSASPRVTQRKLAGTSSSTPTTLVRINGTGDELLDVFEVAS
ncbi:uncharacterized protein LOC144090757 [Stigmatopora argus]